MRYFLIALLRWSTAVTLTIGAFWFSFYAERIHDRERLLELQEFGDSAKVVEIYRYRSGTKPANYREHTVAAVENQSQISRKNIEFYAGPSNSAVSPVVGEIWSLRYNERSNCIELGERLETFNARVEHASLVSDPTKAWCQQNSSWLAVPVFIGTAAVPLLFLLGGCLCFIGLMGFVVSLMTLPKYRQASECDREMVWDCEIVLSLAFIVVPFVSLLVDAVDIAVRVDFLNKIALIGFGVGILGLLVTLVFCLMKS